MHDGKNKSIQTAPKAYYWKLKMPKQSQVKSKARQNIPAMSFGPMVNYKRLQLDRVMILVMRMIEATKNSHELKWMIQMFYIQMPIDEPGKCTDTNR